ncbi:MAG: hypothetical protein FJW23_15145 [Acidimicrobiia bacterium]|nr:hypothetical protein [Acidimicrobiia bacterium]
MDPASLPDRERAFAEQLTGAALVGSFTSLGRENPSPRPDRYDISSVEKVDDDLWRFNVRMRHATVDITVPVVVPLTFVNGLPLISMTDYDIPGLGRFSAHVVFDGDWYAGTWKAGTAGGGHMFGRIEKED